MVRFKMLGKDGNSQFLQYRSWVVNNQPDFDGYFYTGDKSGSTPLLDITAYAITDPSVIADFNFPNALDFSPTRQTLPAYICDSQLAVIDGYIYLFGGQNTAHIFRASVNNPATWTDTGATLPSSLAGSQLAIVDGYIYLFGGSTDASLHSPTDTIYFAPISNPLNWTNNGHLLPQPVSHSQLAVIGNNLYLFGGCGNNVALNNIWRAPISNPLSWIDTGQRLPDPLFGSQVGMADGYVLLFGGLLSPTHPTANIYLASLSSPLTWSFASILSYPAYYGQFFTVGTQGFLITPTSTPPAPPIGLHILRCQLSAPTVWYDTARMVSDVGGQSQVAVIDDRLFLFGGNGSTVIVADNSIWKYDLTDLRVIAYGNTTRTQVQAASNQLALFEVLGFPPWKTDFVAGI